MKIIILIIVVVLVNSFTFAQQLPSSWANIKPYQNKSSDRPELSFDLEETKKYGELQPTRFLIIDPHADSYPSWTPYNYVANNPMIIIDPDGKDWYNLGDDDNPDIQWRDGSEDQLKSGIWNSIKDFFGAGEYTESLGENVLVAAGSLDEEVNGATFSLYLESNKEGATATIAGNTISADRTQYATVAPGTYSAELTTYKSNPALLINGGGNVPTVGNNPNPNASNFGRPLADEIFFHAGNRARESLTTLSGRAISKGCLTGCNGNRQNYTNFMSNFSAGWTGNLHLIRK